MNLTTLLAGTGSSPLIERLGWVLVHSLWQFALIAFLAIVFLSLMKKSSASLRHGILLAHLLIAVLLPLSTWAAIGSSALPHQAEREIESFPQSATLDHVNPVQPPVEITQGPTEPASVPAEVKFPKGTDPRAPVMMPSTNAFSIETTAPSAPPATKWWNLTIDLVRPWLGPLVAVWALGFLLFSLRPLIGWWALYRLKTRGLSPVPESVRAMARSLSRRLALSKKVELFQSYLAKTPLVIGYFQPIILLPISVVAGIPASQLEAILIHELAHVRRHDFLVNLLQTLVETVFFYHPAIWFLSDRIRIERENCCDDLVVGIVADRAEYGRALLAVEELRGNQSILALGATHGSLLARVHRILAIEPRKAGLLGRWPLIGLAPLSLGLCLLFGQLGAAPNSDLSIAEAPTSEISDPETSKDEKGASKSLPLTGRILMPDGSPAVGAEVLAVLLQPASTAEMRRETKADTEGRFRLTLPALATQKGEWVVSVRRGVHFGKYENVVSIPGRDSKVSRHEVENLNDLKLKPGHRIEGWALAQENRRPLAKATVWSGDGQKVQTDAQGFFIFDGLSKDVQRLLVTHPERVRTSVYVDLSEQKIGRVKVLLPTGGMIQGEVTHGGQPVKDGHVYWRSGGALINQGLTEPIDPNTGKFSYGGLRYNRLLPILWVNAPGMETETTNLLVLRPGKPVQQIKMALQKTPSVKGTDYGAMRGGLAGDSDGAPNGSIRGRVLQDNGKPVTEFTVNTVVDYFPHNVGGRDHGGGSFFSEDGTFAIGQLVAGKKYAVAVTSPSYARTIVSPVTARLFQPEAPDKAEVTEFRLKPATLQVDLVVRDAVTKKPIPEAMVCFKPDVWYQDDFSWNLGNHGSDVRWSDQDGKMLWDRMEIDKGIFFINHPGYGRAVLPWRIAKGNTSTGANETKGDMVPENRINDASGEWEVVLIPDPVLPLRRNEASGRYEAVFDLIPEATLEVKINNANGRDLKWLVFDAEQMSLPGSKAARSAGRPLIQRYMEELPTKEGLFRFDGLNPGPAKWKIRDQVDEHNGVINEHGSSMDGLIVREMNLVSGINRIELDLPPRAPAKTAQPEKNEPGMMTEAQITEMLDMIDTLKNEKTKLLLKLNSDHPDVKKNQTDIEGLEALLKKYPPTPVGEPVLMASPGKCRLEGGALLEITYAENAPPKTATMSGSLSLPGFAKKVLFGPKSVNEQDWGVGWIKGGTTLWLVTRLKQSLKILDVRFGTKDQTIGNEIWSKESIIPSVRGRVIAESGMPASLAALFSKMMIGSGPILLQGEGDWFLDNHSYLELKERKLIAPLVGPTTNFVGIVRRHSSNEPVGEIPLAMVPGKDSVVMGWYVWTNIWVAQKNGASAQLSRFDWTKPKVPGQTRQISGPAEDFPRGVMVDGIEIPKELALAMAEQFRALESKKEGANQGSSMPLRPTGTTAKESGGEPPVGEKAPATKAAAAIALLKERVEVALALYKSSRVEIESVLSACKDLAEFEPSEALKSLEFVLEIAQARVKAARATELEVLAAKSAMEVIKLRLNPAPEANATSNPPGTRMDPQVITTKGTWNLEKGLTVEVMEQTFDAPIIGTFKQNVASIRRSDTKELIKEVRLGIAEEKDKASWAIGWMPGRESLWIVTGHDRSQQLTKYRVADSQLVVQGVTQRNLGGWNRDQPINEFGIPHELGYEMASRFSRRALPRRSPGTNSSTRPSAGPAKELLEQVKDLQGSWTWQKPADQGNAVLSRTAPANSAEQDRLVHLIVRGDQVRLIVTLASGSPILDKTYTLEVEKDNKGIIRLLLRSQNNPQAIPFPFERNTGDVLSLNIPSQGTTSSSRWIRVAGEEKLKGTWALVSGKPLALGREPLPADLKLELAFHEGRYDLRVFRARSSLDPSVKEIPGQSGSFHLTQSADHKAILHLSGSAPSGSLVVVWGSHTMRFPDDKTLQLISEKGEILEWKRLDGPIEDSAAAPRKP